MKRKRVLVTTVDTWCGVTGSDSMAALMKDYGKENVASLSIRADYAQSDAAYKYFHICEQSVLKSVFIRKTETGEAYEYDPNRKNEESVNYMKEHQRYSLFRKHRWGIFLIARELMWRLGNWKSRSFETFINEVEPEVLVCPIESYICFNRINEYIIKSRDLKVIGFLWDDNFSYKQSRNFWMRVHRFFLRKSVRRLVNSCSVVFALSPKMKEECDREFCIDSQLLTKPIFNMGDFVPYIVGNPIRVLYTGNLYVGRDKTMVQIANALDVINKNEIKVTLDIYTNSQIDEKRLQEISRKGYCRIHPPVLSSEVKKLQQSADVLLFVEAIGSDANMSARLSFSTKITDYFAAGRCIWAVGHPELGPVDYLMRNDAALMSYDKNTILETLQSMVADTSIINQYAKKGVLCGQKNHDGNLILEKLYRVIDE